MKRYFLYILRVKGIFENLKIYYYLLFNINIKGQLHKWSLKFFGFYRGSLMFRNQYERPNLAKFAQNWSLR